jgi:hypothetical protein
LKAEVVEGVLGGSQSFWFMTRPQQYFTDAAEYLIVALPTAQRGKPKSEGSEEEARIACRMQVPYTTDILPLETLIPVEALDRDGIWLADSAMSVVKLTGVPPTMISGGPNSPVRVFEWTAVRDAFSRRAGERGH